MEEEDERQRVNLCVIFTAKNDTVAKFQHVNPSVRKNDINSLNILKKTYNLIFINKFCLF
ncbi:hypothetical protein WN943_024075 [Citrus x changshan-huyou]